MIVNNQRRFGQSESLQGLDCLLQTRGNHKAAVVRHFYEEDVKNTLFIIDRMAVPIAIENWYKSVNIDKLFIIKCPLSKIKVYLTFIY